ncbi:MAG: hypothetical protein JWL59_4854 [Chthoniobacteraceae bacterium]|nr:hypothetical protein [Chthoniobacteraceae bacterium]
MINRFSVACAIIAGGGVAFILVLWITLEVLHAMAR